VDEVLLKGMARAGIGSFRSRAIIISCCVFPSKGSFPVSISYVISASE
jgi:hypothetical protein